MIHGDLPWNTEIENASLTLWEYHRLEHRIEPADMVLILGSHDLRVGNRAAELHRQGIAPLFLFTGGFLNLVLFAFNLLPIPPLDGSVILSNLSTTVARWYSHPQAGIAGLMFLLFLIWTNAASFAFSLAHQAAGAYVGILYTLFAS